MMLSLIQQDDVIFISKILAYKMSFSSREDEFTIGFINASYKMCFERVEVNLCEILKQKLFYILDKIKKKMYATLRFGSLINSLFFHSIKRFPTMLILYYNSDKYTMESINYNYRNTSKDHMNNKIPIMIKIFQTKMSERIRTSKLVVERYKKKIYFIAETNKTCMEAIIPRVIFVDHLCYEFTKVD